MKPLIIFISLLIFYSSGFSQILTNVDFITPFHDGLAAVKKNTQWGFMNEQGKMVIHFRDDLVSSEQENTLIAPSGVSQKYPFFSEGKCLIKSKIDGVYYYGFIDNTGKEVIAPQFLNATNFKDGFAIIIKFETKIMGENKVLNKRMVSYKLEEYIIDVSGNILKYLDNARNITPSNLGSNEPPPIFESKFIAPHIIAVKNKDQKWDLIEF
jgi:hypothetical protein